MLSVPTTDLLGPELSQTRAGEAAERQPHRGPSWEEGQLGTWLEAAFAYVLENMNIRGSFGGAAGDPLCPQLW